MQTGAEANDANDDANDDHGDATSFVCERSPQYVTELVKLVKKCEPMVQSSPPRAHRFFLAGPPAVVGHIFEVLFLTRQKSAIRGSSTPIQFLVING
jgi:hypothetical protein